MDPGTATTETQGTCIEQGFAGYLYLKSLESLKYLIGHVIAKAIDPRIVNGVSEIKKDIISSHILAWKENKFHFTAKQVNEETIK